MYPDKRRPRPRRWIFTAFLVAPVIAAAQVTKELPTNRERGLDLNLYFNCWQNSDQEFSHGALAERPVLTAGDPQHVTKPGAVLIYAKRFSRAVLPPHQ